MKTAFDFLNDFNNRPKKTSVKPTPQTPSKQFNKKILFTINPSLKVGIAHQLSYFNVFYKLGIHLGFKYLHTPFCSNRSSRTIYSFLGFNRHFNTGEFIFCSSLAYKVKNLLTSCKYKTIDLNLNSSTLCELSLNSFEDLLEHIRTVTSCYSMRPLLVRFSGKTGNVYKWIHSNLVCSSPLIDLRSSYFSRRALYPWQSRYQTNTIKILVHIRQGDTALIPTPWNTFIDTAHMRELKTTNLSEARYTNTEDYLSFLKHLIDYIRPQNYSIVVCSDGYKRGFRKIFKNKRTLGLSTDQVRQLKRMENSFETKKFRAFASLPNCVAIIGESEQNLFDLIHSAMLADLIVFGNQQKMMPRLMENYADPLSPPILVHLHNTEKVKGHGDLGLSSTNIKLTSINLRNNNNSLIKQIGKDLIKNRTNLSKYC